ncbi:hypothetical protein GF1_10480 [Desulfolithobacter dissulfuricans]|uniref:Lipoprotein n=1 Tax=Desulfolithobacter dissulfuricans TaxID=2795293 RepID=A0A915U1B7_9BACT|nr:hypothetical protein [Desulfolithobacter dissulfuricans]BCO08672.1 hypothetical protein GF1_10480 [Desulfolithobacter dissulfuricans]
MTKGTRRVALLLCSVLLVLLLQTGCTTFQYGGSSAVEPGDSALPPVSGFADDISDIVLPTEMEWDRKKSMTIKTESFRGGIWHYVGKVEVISLKDFMIKAMQDNKWKLVGEATSENILLAFIKPNKTCMMVIEDSTMGKTHLALYVTIDKTAAASPSPFAEVLRN